MTDAEFIAQESAKHATALRRALSKVRRRGETSKEASESLWTAGLILFGPPVAGVCEFNCWHLTDLGKAELAKLEATS